MTVRPLTPVAWIMRSMTLGTAVVSNAYLTPIWKRIEGVYLLGQVLAEILERIVMNLPESILTGYSCSLDSCFRTAVHD